MHSLKRTHMEWKDKANERERHAHTRTHTPIIHENMSDRRKWWLFDNRIKDKMREVNEARRNYTRNYPIGHHQVEKRKKSIFVYDKFWLFLSFAFVRFVLISQYALNSVDCKLNRLHKIINWLLPPQNVSLFSGIFVTNINKFSTHLKYQHHRQETEQ